MNQPKLFTPFQIGGLNLANRIVVGPMCQYSADNGQLTDRHLMHLGQLAASGAGLLTVEATAVTSDGRITHGDAGLYSDACEAAMAQVLDGLRKWSDIPIGIQLSHAGRKGSCRKPWEGGAQIPPTDTEGWTTYGPSAIGASDDAIPPVALSHAQMNAIRDAFAEAAWRASRLGLDLVQIHGGHGYLLHGFLSPLSNQREDEYGGSLENRMRFPLEIFDAVRAAFRPDRPVTMRISVTDWVEGGWSTEDSIAFVGELETRGCAGVDASSGGSSPRQEIPIGPGYQVPLARALKENSNLPITAVGLITEYEHAESILGTGDADLIALARGMLFNPRWPWHAAAHFGASVKVPDQYLRSQPSRHRDLFR